MANFYLYVMDEHKPEFHLVEARAHRNIPGAIYEIRGRRANNPERTELAFTLCGLYVRRGQAGEHIYRSRREPVCVWCELASESDLGVGVAELEEVASG